ncbi:MAG: HU family DNA-binding protein [Lachnospiraceae bacterium]|nr:HU family DNA-binding protein [Lachnospiraceae bacterium]
MSVLKKEFINRMAENGGITKKAAKQGLELFIETLMDCMCENEKVMFSGFGRFEMKTAKERKGRVPLSGEECIVPEHKKMKFYASDTLADKIDEILEENDTYGIDE